MKRCKDSWCRKLKPLDQFIDERNGKETKVCLKCRINLRDIRKRMKERAPDYYKEVNAERVKKHIEKNSYYVDCGCGTKLKKYNLRQHYKSKKHQKYLNKCSSSSTQ